MTAQARLIKIVGTGLAPALSRGVPVQKDFRGETPEVCSGIGISIIPILWIQTDKGRLKTDKIPPHPCPLPANLSGGERIKVRGRISGAKPLKYVL